MHPYSGGPREPCYKWCGQRSRPLQPVRGAGYEPVCADRAIPGPVGRANAETRYIR